MSPSMISRMAFILLFLAVAHPLVSPSLALFAGFFFSFFWGNPYETASSKASKILLKLSVVGLGFGVHITDVIHTGKASIGITLAGIILLWLAGSIAGRFFHLPANTQSLLTFGTAICGGSAIAAMAPVLKAKDHEIAVSIATVFILNAVALVLFPPLGNLFGLDQPQFGFWAAMAIHDTSSVVGATSTYGPEALAVGTTVKLTRALWIAPCVLLVGLARRSSLRTGFPLFIVGFVLAALLNSELPALSGLWEGIYLVSKRALVMTLFLIGAALTPTTLKQTGVNPFTFGLLLWVTMAGLSLWLVVQGYIG